jgi:hypothetical protein
MVDGNQVIHETVNYANPVQSTIAIANYDDHYLAQRYIEYFKLLAKDATRTRILEIGTGQTKRLVYNQVIVNEDY